MTRDENADLLIARVIVREGGVADVRDGKGVTRFGQTDDWLQDFGLDVPSDARKAADNYRRWLDMTGLIALCEQADSLADVVIDFAVHSGARTAIAALQRALGVKADGVIGPVTSAALAAEDRSRLARRVLADRARLLGRLITDAPEANARYAANWLNRLAGQIATS